MPQRGGKRLAVICPAFVSDCLETLDEMGLRGRGERSGVSTERRRYPTILATRPEQVPGAISTSTTCGIDSHRVKREGSRTASTSFLEQFIEDVIGVVVPDFGQRSFG